MKKLILKLLFIPLAIILLVSCGEDKSPEEYLNIALEKYGQCKTGIGQGYECDSKGLYNNISKALKVNSNLTQAYYIRYYIRNDFDGASNEAIEDLEKYIELLTKNKIFDNDGNTVLANSHFTLESSGHKRMSIEESVIYALLELSKSGYKWAMFSPIVYGSDKYRIDRDYWSESEGVGYWDNSEHIKSLGNSKSAYKEMINKGIDNFKKIRDLNTWLSEKKLDKILIKLSQNLETKLDYEQFLQIAEEALKLENFNEKNKYRSIDDEIGIIGDKYYIHFVSHDSLSDYYSTPMKISANQEYLPIRVNDLFFNIRTKDILGKKPGDIIDTLDLGIFNNRSIIADNNYSYGGAYNVIKINSIDEFSIGNIYLPWKYDATLELAKLYYDNCDLNNAFNLIDKAIEINPDRFEAYSIKGDFYLPIFPRRGNDLEKPDIWNTNYNCFEAVDPNVPRKDINWYENEGNNKFFSKENAFLNYAKAYEINPNFENIFNKNLGKPQTKGTYNKLNFERDSISGQVKVSIKEFDYVPPRASNDCNLVGENRLTQSGKIVTGSFPTSNTRIVYTYMDRDTQIEGGVTYIFDDNCNVINILFE